jgi:CRISPR-associated protein Csb2
VFADRWLVLEHVDGDMPDLRAAALVGRELRRVLMSGYKQNGREAEIPAIVSGHMPDGGPLGEPHLAIVPLAYVGSEYADGHVYGFALVPPDGSDLLSNGAFQSAIRAVAEWNEKEGRRELALKCGGFDLSFTPSGEAPLAPESHGEARPGPPRHRADRHLKAKGNAERDAEMAGLVRQACANIGLPEPMRVSTGKHSALRGAPPAYPSGGMPRWMRWRLPDSLASRQLTHAAIQFDEPVRGPVILGAGRFSGLGLCRALDPETPA